MRFEDLTPEMVEKAKKCETPEDRKAFMFIEEDGIELTEGDLFDRLARVRGGPVGEQLRASCCDSFVVSPRYLRQYRFHRIRKAATEGMSVTITTR